jgi:hypothetical protein
MNSLWMKFVTVCVDGRSVLVECGRMATKQFLNVALFASASDCRATQFQRASRITTQTYLVIANNMFGDHGQDHVTREFFWRLDTLEGTIKSRLFGLVFLLRSFHLSIYISRNGVVVHFNARVLTSDLIHVPVQAQVLPTGRCAANVKCFSQSILTDKTLVISNQKNRCVRVTHVTDRLMIMIVLASFAPSSLQCLNLHQHSFLPLEFDLAGVRHEQEDVACVSFPGIAHERYVCIHIIFSSILLIAVLYN